MDVMLGAENPDPMIRAELRYFGQWALLTCAILSVIAIDVMLWDAFHLNAVVAALLFLALCAVAVIGTVMWWMAHLQRRMRSEIASATNEGAVVRPSSLPAAHYAPVIVTVGAFGLQLWVLLSWFSQSRAAHTALPAAFYLTLCMLLLMTLMEIGDRNRRRSGIAVPAFTEKRWKQMRSALEMPTREERRAALRPLVLRGYARLGLIVVAVVAECSLAPRVGIGWAFACGVGGVAVVFIALRVVWDICAVFRRPHVCRERTLFDRNVADRIERRPGCVVRGAS